MSSAARAYLNSLPTREVKPGLSRTLELLARVGNPHTKLRAIHIGGTNGKGSVAAMIASILRAAGYRTGLYTSPHLLDFPERFTIDGSAISESDLTALIRELAPIADALTDRPTQFEFLTAMGFLYFARRGIDCAVIEVGLGGRFDATNVIVPLLSLITNVEYDHMDLLGDRLEQIAWEKAGIIKPGVPVITGERKTGPFDVIAREAQRQGAELIVADAPARLIRYDWNFQELDIEGWGRVRLGLLGEFQIRNVTVALSAVRALRRALAISEAAVVMGLERTRWPGRFEVCAREPYIVLDGAHNAHGAQALRETLARYSSLLSPQSKKYLLFGVLRDKPFAEMGRLLFPLFDLLFLGEPASHRACPAQALKSQADALGVPAQLTPSARAGTASARAMMDRGDLLVVTGSLYWVGEARGCLS